MSREVPRESADESDAEAVFESDRLTHAEWQEALESGVLLGLECAACEYVTATPKLACVRCGHRAVSPVRLPTRGTVYSQTRVEVAPDAQGSGYQIALVDVGDARILGRIADGASVDVEDEVELRGTYEYGGDLAPSFEPV